MPESRVHYQVKRTPEGHFVRPFRHPVGLQHTDVFRGEGGDPCLKWAPAGACPRPTDQRPWAEGPAAKGRTPGPVWRGAVPPPSQALNEKLPYAQSRLWAKTMLSGGKALLSSWARMTARSPSNMDGAGRVVISTFRRGFAADLLQIRRRSITDTTFCCRAIEVDCIDRANSIDGPTDTSSGSLAQRETC